MVGWLCFVCSNGSSPDVLLLFLRVCQNTVLGERTAFFGSSQLMVFGGHDDGLRTYYNDAWLLRVKTETKADHERTEWYWQSTDLDGDADDNMQIPERRDGAGMVYLPSYVDFLSVTNTAYVHNTPVLFFFLSWWDFFFFSDCSSSSPSPSPFFQVFRFVQKEQPSLPLDQQQQHVVVGN